MGSNFTMLIIMGVVILALAIAYLVSSRKGSNNKSSKNINTNTKVNATNSTANAYKKNMNIDIPREDIFNFMEFDKIQDNMIIQQNGEKYTAVIKCKGINYNLMSEVEQLAIEEGFMNFLNTLKFPVQLYVQAQSVDLKASISSYKDNMKSIWEEYDEVNSEYNSVINSLESTDEQIEQAEDKRNSVLNVLEYGQDIVKYVEKLAGNKNMLQRSFYVLVSYYKSELSNASSFNKEELLDVCYTELFTRVENIISGLSMSAVNGTILNSNEIADLIYSAYNKDDKNALSVQQALEAGFYRLYSTSEDAITKKHKRIAENIRKEAEYKAIEALNRAIDEGTYMTRTDIEDEYDQATSKQAIEIVQNEKVSEKVKQDAKKIIVEDYKKAKKERIEKQDEEMKKIQKKIAEIKGETLEIVEENHAEENKENDNENVENESIV